MSKTHTRGNVIVEDIKVGDIHYEYDYGMCFMSEVLTKPELSKDGQWEWKAKSLKSGNEIDYLVDPEYSHYSANLYDYEAYRGCKQV